MCRSNLLILFINLIFVVFFIKNKYNPYTSTKVPDVEVVKGKVNNNRLYQ